MNTGIVGERVWQYQLYGPVYKIAEMMRTNSDLGVFLVSENTKKLIKATKLKETTAYRYRPSVCY